MPNRVLFSFIVWVVAVVPCAWAAQDESSIHRLFESPPSAEFSNIYIEYTQQEWLTEISGKTLDELEREIAGRPEHPLRRDAERLALGMSDQGIFFRYRIWYGNEGRWRVSIDTNDPSSPWAFSDSAQLNPDLAWQVVMDQVHYFDPRAMPDGVVLIGDTGHLKSFATHFLARGFLSCPDDGVSIEIVNADWSAVAAYGGGRAAIRFRGAFDDGGEPYTTERTVVKHESNMLRGHVFRLDDWAPAGPGRLLAPHRITVEQPDGVVASRKQLVEFRELRANELDRATAVPDVLAGGDALRDYSGVVEVVDHRPSKGSITSALTGETMGQLAPAAVGSDSSQLYWVGWVMAGVLVSLIIFTRIRTHTPKGR